MTRPPRQHREAFGQRLETIIGRSTKSREDLAQDLGLHVNTIGNWLRADTDCAVGWLPGIAATLDVSMGELVGEHAPVSIPPEGSPSQEDVDFAERVVDVLERPLTAPDLMGLLSEAKARVPSRESQSA